MSHREVNLLDAANEKRQLGDSSWFLNSEQKSPEIQKYLYQLHLRSQRKEYQFHIN